MSLPLVRYVDTSFFEDKGTPADLEFKRKNPKTLKDLASQYLNAVIQEKHHSSVSSNY